MQTQTIMVLEACSRCGQPIAPGEARHADRLGGPGRVRQSRVLPSEDVPPERRLLRRLQEQRGPSQGRIDGSLAEPHQEVR